MNVLISIVSYNTKDLLRNLLEYLVSYRGDNKVEIWVLDNNSSDGSAQMVMREFKNVELVKSDKNLGFAKGQNEILKKGNFDLVLLFNSDAEIEYEGIDRMVKFMEDNPKVGIASCKILKSDGSLDQNGGDLPIGLALYTWLFNLEIFWNLPNFHRMEKEYYRMAHEVGWVGGTAMFVRKEVFEKIGYLNEKYFMYFEDVEFCYRAKKAGFIVMLNPDVSIKHIGGASSKNPRFAQWRGETSNLIQFYRDNWGSVASFIVKLLIYKAMLLRALAFGLLGKFKTAQTYLKVIYEI